MRLWKIFYDPAQQKRILKKALDFGFAHSPALPIGERARQAADAIHFFIPTFKNQDFGEESELRLIFTPPPNCSVRPQFRVARGMLVPYYSLRELSGGFPTPNDPLPITGVRIGPSAQKLLNVASTQMLLNDFGYPGVRVEYSATPYRG